MKGGGVSFEELKKAVEERASRTEDKNRFLEFLKEMEPEFIMAICLSFAFFCGE